MLKGDMINRGSKDTEKKLTKEQIVYLWLLQHTWNHAEMPTIMEAWEVRNSVWEREQIGSRI